MGLDAYVMCRCWQDGLAVPPWDPALVEVGADGCLGLDLPWEGHEEEHRAFQAWMRTACPHPTMRLFEDRVANWNGVHRFQVLLRPLTDRFPLLATLLPERNGGTVASGVAREMLAEIDEFRSLDALGERAELRDELTGERVGIYLTVLGFQIAEGRRPYGLGVDPEGFFVRHEDNDVELFRSLRFRQRPVEGGVEFSDGSATVRFPFPPLEKGTQMRVVLAPVSPDELAYIVDTLERLGRESVATGNPIVWW